MIAELWNGLSMGNMVTEQEYAKISIEEHGRIMDAIAAGDGERAKKEMYAHNYAKPGRYADLLSVM